jgi:tubulin polyglutamylase TTLL6/13
MDSQKKRKKRPGPAAVLANVTNTRYAIVRACCEELGYALTESVVKNHLFWCDTGGNFEFMAGLSPWQFYNHFPGTWALARKVDLARNIERMARLAPDIYDFHPKSFVIPCQTSELQAYLISISRRSRKTFIVKPDKGSLGKGIILIRDGEALSDWTDLAIAQCYIPPYLIDGLKFDLRIYALVSSVDPLRIYLHDEGMARFCTQPYVKPSGNNLELSFGHLTNYSLNKSNPNFEENDDAEHADRGHKRSLSSVLRVMAESGVDADVVRARIEDIVRLTVISVQPLLATNYRTGIPWHDGKSRCFEVLGFDIMLDKRGKAWLLEVNWAPSLATGSPFDVAIKKSVVTGALKIVNIPPNFRRIVKNRRIAISQQREIGVVFDVNEEFEIAKTTPFHLIYPLPETHPRFQATESAFREAQMSTVGAAVQPARAKARQEAFMAQARVREPPPRPVGSPAPQLLIPRAAAPPPPIPLIERPGLLPPVARESLDSGPRPPMARGVFGATATKLIAPVPRPRRVEPPPSARAPIVVPRIVAPIPRPVPASLPVEWPGIAIDRGDERERLRAIGGQICLVEFRGLPEEVARLVGAPFPPRLPPPQQPQRNHFHVTNLMKSLSVLPARKSTRLHGID